MAPSRNPATLRHSDRRVVSAWLFVVGVVLLALGVLLSLFTLFQLVGTNYLQQQHQQALRYQLATQLSGQHYTKPLTTTEQGVESPRPLGYAPAPLLGSAVAWIDIPAIGVHQIIVEGTGEEQLQLGPGHYLHTALPGQQGVVGIAGHRTTWGRPFYNLNELVRGTKIILTSPEGRFVYSMTRSQVVDPMDSAVLDPTRRPTLVLTTCTPRYSAAQRLVVFATLTSSMFRTAGSRSVPGVVVRHGGASSRGALAPVSVKTGLPAGIGAVVVFGLLATALCFGAWWVLRRQPRRRRWPLVTLGVLLELWVLFYFFAALTPLLPASF